MTVKEIEENTATNATFMLMRGMLHVNQGFHLTDSEEGGTSVEDRAAYTAPRLLARMIRRIAHAVHTALTENIRQHFLEISQ